MRVAVAGAFSATLIPEIRARLAVPCEIISDTEDAIARHLGNAEVLVSMAFTAVMAQAAPRLKLVQVPGAGLDRIERGALPAGAWLANVYGHEAGIAEYVLGAMLTLARNYAALDASLRRGLWDSQWAVGAPIPPAHAEFAGKTLGILGYGRIGQALAKRARAFDMQVLGLRRSPGSDAYAELHGPDFLDELLRRADYLVVTAALTPATRGLVGARELGLLRPSAVLVNVARGEIVEPQALYDALATKRIAAAVLDVWYRYPGAAGATLPAAQPFHQLPNVLMTPHVSGWTEGMLTARAAAIAENISRVARGEPPLNLIA